MVDIEKTKDSALLQTLEVEALDSSAWQNFVKQGLPTRKNEDWKYTDLSRIYQKCDIKSIALKVPTLDKNLLDMLNLNQDVFNIVFIDGRLAYVDKDDQLEVITIVRGDDDLSARHSTQLLNRATALTGCKLKLKANCHMDKPIMLTYIHSEAVKNQLVSYRNYVTVEPGAKCSINECYINFSNDYSAMNIESQLDLAKDAVCQYDALANASNRVLLVNNYLSINLSQNALFDTFQLSAQSALNRIDFEVNLLEAHASFFAKGIYALAGQAHGDYHFYVNHLASHTTSDVDFRAIVNGKAKATFNAKAYVAKGLGNIKALQNNRNIQLSDTAEINTKPELEIYSDDVVCAHGATIGYLDEQAMFYLQSRGISKPQASQLLIEGFAKAIITELKRSEAVIESYVESFEGHIKLLLH